MEVQKVTVSTAIDWIKNGFELYKKEWLTFSALSFGLLILSIIMNAIPLVSVLWQFFGFALCTFYFFILFNQLHNGQILNLKDAFNELIKISKNNFMLLLLFAVPSVIGFVGGEIVGYAFNMITPNQYGVREASGAYGMMNQLFSSGLSGGAVVFALGLGIIFFILLLVVAALYIGAGFCVEPVIFRGVNIVDAFKASWKASIVNVIPLLVYGILIGVLTVIACIPLGLGLLVTGPLGMASVYLASRDMLKA